MTQAPTIKLPTGATVTGTLQTNAAGKDVRVFRGIPYAEPPVDENRWKQAKLKPLTSDLDATAFGSIAYGIPVPVDPDFGKYPQSEDCLFLNVYTPVGATKDSNLPVMVWIHGGGMVFGSGNSADGSNLIGAADQKLVVVSFNYRLGVFGFLSNDAILAEGDGANFGLRDQEVAFQWVKQHIQAFGGNPNDITAFGESAGAISVAMHMISREGDQKLFQKGIMQSCGHAAYAHDMNTPATQEAFSSTLATGAGCASLQGAELLERLRKLDAAEIFAAGGAQGWHPTVDNVFLLDAPVRRVLSGKVSQIPTIQGVNTDEGWIFFPADATADEYNAMLRADLRALTDAEFARLEELYPVAKFPTLRHRASEIFSDVTIACPSELFSRVLAKASPTYRYRFNHTSDNGGHQVVIHTQDIAYVFNDAASLPSDDETKSVVGYFQKYWTNFATTGSPNGNSKSLVEWPLFNTETEQQLVLQPTLSVETTGSHMPLHKERSEFWLEVDLASASRELK